ncbi:MAG: zinc-dependent metalloprotease [Bdellovibrionales bacterium]|nr:zinc-dependent metalloprotease [Bdellovibrionales bacterium]
MKSLMGISVVAMTLAVALTACTKTEKEIVYQYPPKDVLESFSTATCAKKNCVKIAKSSLNKTFLLMISGKSIDTTPQWMDLKPSVVIFQQSGAQVGLFAVSTEAIYGNEDAKNLIQSFDVIADDADSVTFDWGAGITSLRTQGTFDTEIDMGDDDGTNGSSLQILNSFVKSVSISKDLIEVSQISKILQTKLISKKDNPFDPKDEGKPKIDVTESTLNINVQFYPYSKNPNFTPKAADKSRTVGFFVTKIATPEVADEKQIFITKWDFSAPKGPVRFLVSANTPKEYLESVREGLLYWNKVFGFEAVRVETGVDDSSVPPLHAVMVRWIPWEDAGFAYAQAQNDPLTGEMLRGQLFLTPAFAHTKGYVKKLTPVINPLVACDLTKSYNKGDFLPSNPDELRIAQDDVRSVVAHEAGHALGLRHNFAASASVSLTQKGVLKAVSDYLHDANNDSVMTGTTVMDYLKGTEDILLGKYIKNHPLPYDQMAMKWAYSQGVDGLNPAVSKYCSDEDLIISQGRDNVTIFDCQQGDATGSTLTSLINNHLRNRQSMLQTKYDAILASLFPEDQEVYTGNLDIILNENHTELGLKDLKAYLEMQKNHAGFVSLDKWKNVIQRGLKSDADPALDQMLKDDLAEVGTFADAKNLLTPVSSSWTTTDLQMVLDSIAKGQGTIKGRTYQLTADQQARLNQYFKDEAAYVETELQKQLNDLFVGL